MSICRSACLQAIAIRETAGSLLPLALTADHKELDRPGIGVASLNLAEHKTGNAYMLFSGLAAARAQSAAADSSPAEPSIVPSDFVSWHHIFWTQEAGNLAVLGGTRVLDLQACDQAGLMHPAVRLARAAQSERHVRALEVIVEEHRRNGRRLVYSSEFHIIPTARASARSALIHELLAALTHLDFGDGVATGLTFATHKTLPHFEAWGYQRVQHEGQALPAMADGSGKSEIYLMQITRALQTPAESYNRHVQAMESRLSWQSL